MMGQPAFSIESTAPNTSVTDCSTGGNVIYWAGQNPVPNTKEKGPSIQLENTKEYLDHAKSLSATDLREKYLSTYSSWKNMKQRCKEGGYILDPRFAKFREFLMHMGPRPGKEFTLDRVDSENPNYGPEHCRWADKYTQNQNKGNNVHLTYKGETHTVSVWAKKTKQKSDTLYHRKAKGWTDEEIITGLRKPTPPPPGVEIVRVSRITIEDLRKHLGNVIRAKRAIQEEMLYLYDLNGPESQVPAELVVREEEINRGYWLLLNEMKKRMPGFDVTVAFRHLLTRL